MNHLFTADTKEGESSCSRGYTYEGFPGYVWRQPPSTTANLPAGTVVAIYRFQNPNTRDHCYTTKADGADIPRQKDYVKQNGGAPVWYMYSTPASMTLAFYRFSHQPGLTNNSDSFYSTDPGGESSGYDKGQLLGYLPVAPLDGTVKLLRYYSGYSLAVITPDALIPATSYSTGVNNSSSSGYLPQPPDDLDHYFSDKVITNTTAVGKIDKIDLAYNTNITDIPFDQGANRNCSVHAVAAAMIFGANGEKYYKDLLKKPFEPSRMWIWWIGRLVTCVGEQVKPEEIRKFMIYQQGNGGNDTDILTGVSGSTLNPKTYANVKAALMQDTPCLVRTLLHSIRRVGVVTELDWSYDSEMKQSPKGPADLTVASVYAHPDFNFWRIHEIAVGNPNNVDVTGDMEKALANKYPVVFGMYFPTGKHLQFNIGSDVNFIYKYMSEPGPRAGHAVLAVGYDRLWQPDKTKKAGRFKVLNSWGKDYGDQGYFWLPYDCFDQTYYNTNAKATLPQIMDIWVVQVADNAVSKATYRAKSLLNPNPNTITITRPGLFRN